MTLQGLILGVLWIAGCASLPCREGHSPKLNVVQVNVKCRAASILLEYNWTCQRQVRGWHVVLDLDD